MKKSKILKLLVSALSLCLIIGAMVGITAMAETDPGDSNNPEIFSYNVSYSDSLYLYYAVKAELAEGESIYLQLCDAEGNALTEVDGYDFANPNKKYEAKITKYTEQIVHDEKVYVFVTNGVAAKDIDKSEYVKAVIVEADGDTRESELVEYSVLSYLFQRLYVDGVVSATDGKNLIRKDLYQSLVAYGASAQELLKADALKDGNVTAIRDSKYLKVDREIKFTHDKTIVVGRGYEVPAGKMVVGWQVWAYNEDGSKAADGEVYHHLYTFKSKVVVAKPVYADVTTFDGITSDNASDYIAIMSWGKKDGVAVGTTTLNDNYTLDKTVAGATSYLGYDPGAPAADSANAAILQFDVASDYTVGTGDSDMMEIQFGSIHIVCKYSSGNLQFYCLGLDKNGERKNNSATVVLANEGEWGADKSITVRIEYFEGATTAESFFRVYCNGMLVGMFNNYNSKEPANGNVIPAENFSSTNIYIPSNSMNDLVIDNIGIAHSNITTRGAFLQYNGPDFEDGIPTGVTGGNQYTQHMLYREENGNTALRVLKTDTSTGSGDLRFALTEAPEENANTFVFEADVKVTKFGQICVYIGEVAGANYLNKAVFSNGDQLSAFGSAKAPFNEWAHLKIEYAVINGGGRTTVTVTSDSLGTLTATKTDTAPIDIGAATQIVFDHQQPCVHDVLWDNYSVKKIYVDYSAE